MRDEDEFTRKMADIHRYQNSGRCSHYEREAFERGQKAAEEIGNMLNGGDRTATIAGLLSGFMGTHRHLNQEATIALLTALGNFGDLPEHAVSDGRNEFAYKLCRKLREAFREELFWRDPK